MSFDTLIFYFLSLVSVLSALGVLTHRNPLMCSLFLALVMLSLAGLFFLLQAPFLAGVQIIVYAGAVMILFLMVIMLFNPTSDAPTDLTRHRGRFLLKVFALGWFAALVSLVGVMSADLSKTVKNQTQSLSVETLAELLFTKYVLAFEVLGILLLMVAVGAVAMTRQQETEQKAG